MKKCNISVDIPKGMSGTLEEFRSVFTKGFLFEHGLHLNTLKIDQNSKHTFFGVKLDPDHLDLISIDGLTVVANSNTVFTYLGNKEWKVGINND